MAALMSYVIVCNTLGVYFHQCNSLYAYHISPSNLSHTYEATIMVEDHYPMAMMWPLSTARITFQTKMF